MNTIHNNIERAGNFTSSEIVALLSVGKDKKSPGAPYFTYIEEKNMERRLQRSLSDASYAHPLMWGKVVEKWVHELLGTEYIFCSEETLSHPTIPFWKGSPDGKKMDGTVTEIKSPWTLKSFCQLVQPLYDGLTGMAAMNVIRDNCKDGEKYYQQIVSNAILTDSKYAELIVFCPYKSELEGIRDICSDAPPELLSKLSFINFGSNDELPYLNDGGYYKNLNVLRFEVLQEDKDLLTQKVIEAGKLLQPFPPSILLAEQKEEVIMVTKVNY